MKRNHNILRGMAASITAMCACMVLTLSLCTPTGYAAEAPLTLPVRENPVAAGGSYYVILADGTLVQADFAFNRTEVLMENAAAVYTHDEGPVVAVDRDGTLWCLYMGSWGGWLEAFRPDLPYENGNWDGLVKLMEDVAMAAVDPFHGVVLKRDGTLWVAGGEKYCGPWLEEEGDGEEIGRAHV